VHLNELLCILDRVLEDLSISRRFPFEKLQNCLQIANDVVGRFASVFEDFNELGSVVHVKDYQLRSWTRQAPIRTINPPVPGLKGPPEGLVNLIWCTMFKSLRVWWRRDCRAMSLSEL
jgi:hypothetical protein